MSYQPKTGEPCGCKRGVQPDHHATSGRPRFSEFCALFGNCSNDYQE